MEDYFTKYARPLGKLNIFDLKQNLCNWRDYLREELESLIFLKNSLNQDNTNSNYNSYKLYYLEIELKTKNKFLDIINKLENISLKEKECISEFSFEIEKSGANEVDDKIYTKLEYIRDNYNKILLNIQKMISSSPVLLEIREKFERNKSSLTEIFKEKPENNNYINSYNNKTSTYLGSHKIESKTQNKISSNTTTIDTGKEWLDKLDNDLDNLNKEQNMTLKKLENKSNRNLPLQNNKKSVSKDYTGSYIFK
jgi:hypothetical protein